MPDVTSIFFCRIPRMLSSLPLKEALSVAAVLPFLFRLFTYPDHGAVYVQFSYNCCVFIYLRANVGARDAQTQESEQDVFFYVFV